MRKLFILSSIAVLFAITGTAQPIHKFTVKVGVDCESVDSLGGVDIVKSNIVKMFQRVNRAFNYNRQFNAVYDFMVDWDAFYIYDGISAEEVHKPHPEHDYLVVIDGYKSDPREVGGGWCGADILTVYHARTHNDRFNNPFNDQAIDGIIHEFGHGRGMPDIYAMKVDADKNPIAPIAHHGTRCIMDYPYGETLWSDYAVNMINLSGDKMVEIDNLVADMCPDNLSFSVVGPDDKPVKDAKLTFYPVGWYSYSVSPDAVYSATTSSDGNCIFKAEKVFPKSDDFGLKYPNIFVKASSGDKVAYAWLPLYEIEKVSFEGKDTYHMDIVLKDTKPSNPFEFKVDKAHFLPAPNKNTIPIWTINGDGAINWDISEGSYPHSDHIEMSGEQVSSVLRWTIDKNTSLSMERSLVFPMLRTLPNNTHGSLMHRVSLDVPSLINVDGLSLKNGKTESVTINGMLSAVETWCVGKHNIGSGRGTTPVPAINMQRIVFPSVDKPALCEQYRIENIREKPATIFIPEFSQVYRTVEAKGKDGVYLISVSIKGAGTYVIQKGETLYFDVVYSGKRQNDPELVINVSDELKTRFEFVESDIDGSLVLETPDPVINTMFRHAKIRTSESICKTSGGYMHAPGGESYYAAIWANDQAEYVNPFFPYLGYWRGNESAINSFRHFARFMNDEYKPIPSSIIAEGTDIWNGAGDRGDAAMISYGASRFALAYANKEVARELWPLIEWCLEYCRRKINEEGVVVSDTDELEGRFEAGDANLCTSSLYYDALISASYLSAELGMKASVARSYKAQAATLAKNIERYYGATVSGYDTYRYYDGNDRLRAWICIPLTVGIYDRADATVDALCSSLLWQEDGLLTEQGSTTFWDRSTLYALRGIYAAGKADIATEKLSHYSHRRLLEDHVPYPIEAWPEGSQRHLAAESGLYCRVITEGLFGIRPLGFNSFEIKPSMPSAWEIMSIRKIKAFGNNFDITVNRIISGKIQVIISLSIGKELKYVIKEGQTLKVSLS